jgi:aryl-phospho-beta-D-glucosidase BglC (GH1 family)
MQTRLSRGLNLSHWFAQSTAGYGPAHLATFVSPRHLDQVVEAGFTHVRLGVDPDVLFAAGDEQARFVEPVLQPLLVALDQIASRGLTTVLDMHPVGASKDPLTTPHGADVFVARWSNLARALAARTEGGLFLEILNEPEPMKGAVWWALQGRALAAIRQAGAGGPVIVNGGGWSGVEDLVQHSPYADGRIIYTIHHYAPILFTHQTATWSWDVAEHVAGLPWPIAPAQAEQAASAATRDKRAYGFLRAEIAAGRFTRSAMDAELDQLSAWASAHGELPIYVGEFGTYAKAAPVPARLAWVRASREGFERRGFGWAVWDSSPNFGVRVSDARDWRMDRQTLQALGVAS